MRLFFEKKQSIFTSNSSNYNFQWLYYLCPSILSFYRKYIHYSIIVTTGIPLSNYSIDYFFFCILCYLICYLYLHEIL